MNAKRRHRRLRRARGQEREVHFIKDNVRTVALLFGLKTVETKSRHQWKRDGWDTECSTSRLHASLNKFLESKRRVKS